MHGDGTVHPAVQLGTEDLYHLKGEELERGDLEGGELEEGERKEGEREEA